MNMGSPAAAKTYQQISIASDVEGATPHRLIQLMMERVLTKIAMARSYMERKSIAAKGEHIGSAVGLLSGLQASLNHEPGGQVAENFDALYDYMMLRLTEANFRNDPRLLDEVAGLMNELKEAWDAIADEVSIQSQTAE